MAAGPQFSYVRKNRTRPRSLAAFLGLVTTSLLFLCGGALLAVSFEGVLRLVFGVAGFAGYLFYFSRALSDVLPPVFLEGDPDPEKMGANEEGSVVSFRQHGVAAAVLIVSALLLPAAVAHATPSTTFWTPMTLDIQSPGVFHLGMDNYFTVARKTSDGGSSFPTDLTLPEVGVALSSKVQMEFGVDYFGNFDDPWFFNAKIGSPEDVWFKGQPAFEIGVFSVGTKSSGPSRTDYNILHVVIGKTIPGVGRLSIGPYWGNHASMVSSTGESQNTGFMVAFDRGFIPAKDKDGNEFTRLVFAADYASGKNILGGGGGGLYYFFTKDISLLSGPVWFNDEGLNGKWKWSVQLDINLPKLF